VIDIELNESKEVVVIEAALTIGKNPQKVLISKTNSYSKSGTSNPVSGATVTIKTEKGKPFTFLETDPGEYVMNNFHMIPGFTYFIDVEYDGITYSASSYMNEKVQIGDMKCNYFDGFGFFDSGYKIVSFIQDPEKTINYYRINYYVDGKKVDDHGDLTIFSDKLFDGKIVGLSHGSFVFQKTDTVVVELQTIDIGAYNFFSTLKSISGFDSFQSASPANPISNFNNGALGYFSAYTYERRRVVIKDLISK
jgi:hypothetical protein